jgi:hypothetical protein
MQTTSPAPAKKVRLDIQDEPSAFQQQGGQQGPHGLAADSVLWRSACTEVTGACLSNLPAIALCCCCLRLSVSCSCASPSARGCLALVRLSPPSDTLLSSPGQHTPNNTRCFCYLISRCCLH